STSQFDPRNSSSSIFTYVSRPLYMYAAALGGGPDHHAPARAARADIQTRGECRLAREQSLGRHAHLAGRRLDGLGETVDAEDVGMLSQKLADELVWRIHAEVAPRRGEKNDSVRCH